MTGKPKSGRRVAPKATKVEAQGAPPDDGLVLDSLVVCDISKRGSLNEGLLEKLTAEQLKALEAAGPGQHQVVVDDDHALVAKDVFFALVSEVISLRTTVHLVVQGTGARA